MFYSFVVRSRELVDLPEYKVTIGEGVDTFNVVLSDLESFIARLRSLGVTVLETHRLDESEPVQPPVFGDEDRRLLGMSEDTTYGDERVREEDPGSG